MAGTEAGFVSSFVPQAPVRHINGLIKEPTSPTDSKYDEKLKVDYPDRPKQTAKHGKAKPSKQRLFSGAFRHASLHPGDNTSRLGKLRQIDITQSKWVARVDGKDRETVTLNIKSKHESADTRRSFRWVHHQRETTPVLFAEFQQHVQNTDGLYEEELAVATRCLEDVRRQRKISARGRYFECTVHRAETDHKVGEQQTPMRATFVSVPVFALLQDTAGGTTTTTYPSSKEIRTSDFHPLRSLLQYSNILAIDDERDRSQVITKVDTRTGARKPFIQVPELWALVINMYTLITCCPLSVDELCGDNILLKSPDVNAGGPLPMSKDTRTIVKYTDRKGRLVDLECRQWQTLVDYISSVEAGEDEARRVEFATMLCQAKSHYKIVDLRFSVVDRSRWIDIVDSQYDNTEFVHLRLARLGEGDILSLKFAQKQHQTFHVRTLVLTASRLYLEVLKKKLIEAYRARLSKEEVDKLKMRVKVLEKRILRLHRSRLLSRFMLYAARYHLMMPDRRLSIDETSSLGERPSNNRVPRHRRSSGPRHSLSSLWHHSDRSRPSSPSDSLSSVNARVSDPTDLPRSSAEVPQIIIQDEVDSPASIHSSPFNAQPSDEPSTEARPDLSSHQRSPREHLVLDTSAPSIGIDLEAQLSPAQLHVGRPRRSSTTMVNQIRGDEGIPPPLTLPNTPAQPQLRPARIVRRHSTSSSSDSSVTIFDASPLRRPLHADGDAALRVPPRSTNTGLRPAPRRQRTTSQVEQTFRPPIVPNADEMDESEFDHDITYQAAKRISGAIGRLSPFFEWQTGKEDAPGAESGRTERRIPDTSAPARPPSLDNPMEDSRSILDFVDNLLSQRATYTSQGLTADRMGYEAAPTSSIQEVVRRLETEWNGLQEARQKSQPAIALEADSIFHESKKELVLSMYGILRCFVTLDRHDAKVITKIWGIMFELCDLPPKETRQLTYPNRHEVQFIAAAAEQMQKFEVEVSDLLKSVRPDSGEDETAITYKLCDPIVHAFANIVLYLLCIWRATTQYGVEAVHIKEVQSQAYRYLESAEVAFLRMRVHAEADHDRFAGTESLKTADTLLALLVENALEVSDGDSEQDPDSPRFDIRYVYSKYTSECIIRAKRHASARIYKDVKLLIEEIETVRSILTQQRHVFDKLFKIRESSLQALDLRVKRRAFDHLDETAKHFEKLLEHARQAADWNQHFISVRGEDNNKAIYVFTAVTVIFLPLSFVAGLLGMNTKEIRDTEDDQWLFWAVAVPFTVCVLIICVGIVRYKFLLRRRLYAVSGRCFGRRRSRQMWSHVVRHN